MTKILLIVNADDFGLSTEVNLAVARTANVGLVRSASLLVGGDQSDHAATISESNPQLGVGVHLALTQLKPILRPERIPTLVDEHGFFHSGPWQILNRLLTGHLSLSEVRNEWIAQIQRALDLGIRISHLDSHQHLHVLPQLAKVFREVVDKFSIRAMRLPRLGGPIRSIPEWIKGLAIHNSQFVARHRFQGLIRPDHFWGLACSGDLTIGRLNTILMAMQPGSHELMTHPAIDNISMANSFKWNYHWQTETEALCDSELLEIIKRRGIQLRNFRDLVENS